MKQDHLKNSFYPLLFIIIITNALGLTNEILGPDGILYANIAKTIVVTGDWVNLYVNGADWLDKPHLQFWIPALSYKIFGINAFAYKFPAFLCFLATLYYVYKLGELIYSPAVARFAVIMCGSSLHLVLANFDVRAEPYLTAFIIAAIYYLTRADRENRIYLIVLAALAAAAAIMIKGIFVLLTIGSGFLFYYISTRRLNRLFTWRWLCFGILTLLFIVPELYSVYVQFDLHPEKTVFGQQGVSGLKFFFWDSQFGRFFNSGPIKGHSEPGFFIHTTLWAFLPWSFFLVAAVWRLVKKRHQSKLEYIITGSALMTFLVFSFSGFQLPHYIVILIPHFALMAAQYLADVQAPASLRRWKISMNVLLVFVAVLIIWLSSYSGFGDQWYVWLIVVAVVAAALVYKAKNLQQQVMIKGVLFTAVLFYFLNIYFYPPLLQYQSGMVAARQLNALRPPVAAVLGEGSWTYEFYADFPTVYLPNYNPERNRPLYAFANVSDLEKLATAGYNYRVEKTYDDFRVSMLTPEFLNKKTRKNAVTKTAVVVINP